MRTDKIIIAAICAMLCACQSPQDTVPRAEYEDVLYEYSQLLEATNETQQAYIKQSEEVNGILTDLSKISGKTATIRFDVENGTGRLTQVEQIEDNIDTIRKRLEDLERLSADNAALKKVISGLKKVVEEKDKEISTLKKQILDRDKKIKEQDQTITQQSGTINDQYQTILKQKKNLEQAVLKQAQLLYNAGLAFEQLGDESPEIKRKKDREKVENLTREMYEKAYEYYTESYNAGYTSAKARITEVQRKMNRL